MANLKIDYSSINEIIDADFTNVVESDLKVAIKTFQEHYKKLSEELSKEQNLTHADVQEIKEKTRIDLFNNKQDETD